MKLELEVQVCLGFLQGEVTLSNRSLTSGPKRPASFLHSLSPSSKHDVMWKAKILAIWPLAYHCKISENSHWRTENLWLSTSLDALKSCPKFFVPPLSPCLHCMASRGEVLPVPSTVHPTAQIWQRQPRAALLQQHRSIGTKWGTDATKGKRAERLTQQLLFRSNSKQLGTECYEHFKIQFLPNREWNKTIQTMYRI